MIVKTFENENHILQIEIDPYPLSPSFWDAEMDPSDLTDNDLLYQKAYGSGEIYGYILYKKKTCDCCKHVELIEIDSCWGFYGNDYLESMKGQVDGKYYALFGEGEGE